MPVSEMCPFCGRRESCLPHKPFFYQFWWLPLCLHTASPLHWYLHSHYREPQPALDPTSGHSVQTGAVGNRRRKKVFIDFPPKKKTFHSTWCLSHSVLQLRDCFVLLNCSTCRNHKENQVLASLWQAQLGLDLGCSPPFHRHVLPELQLQCRAAACLRTSETLTKWSGDQDVMHLPMHRLSCLSLLWAKPV